VIFRDVEKGEKFAANAASYEFKFEYEPNVIEDRPRPIGDKILNQVFGDITVRGTYKGKRVYLSQSWIKGSPSLTGNCFRPMPGKRVPVVTAENFNLYRFAIEAEGFGSDGPISDRVFTPYGCRA